MKINKKFVLELNKPLGIIKRPLKPLAEKLKISEQELAGIIAAYKKKGYIRRFGVVVAHQRIGLKINALVAWNARAKKINSIAKVFIASPAVSHCYVRRAYAQWPYNLYTMIHARTRDGCLQIIQRLARKIGSQDYAVLFTVRELKKAKTDLERIL